MDDKKNFSVTVPFQKQRNSTSSNVSNKDQLNFRYDNDVGMYRASKRQLEVLEEKIHLDEKSHQNEKNQILQESGEKIKLLEDENDSLKIKTLDQASKINQLDNANIKKGRAIEKLKNREHELSKKISELETQIQQTKETTDAQKAEIESLKCELFKVEKELKKALQERIQNLVTKLEKRDAEMQSINEKRDSEMERKNEKRDAKLKREFESMFEKYNKTILDQIKTSSENNDKTTINSTGTVQINHTISNGTQNTHRQIYPMKQVTPVFEDGRKYENSTRSRMQRGHGTCGRQQPE